MTAPKAPKAFDLRKAQADLARLRKRARRIEQQAGEHMRQALTQVSVATYTMKQLDELLTSARTFLDGSR